MKPRSLFRLAGLSAAFIASNAFADVVVSVNFQGANTVTLGSSDITGAVAAANWNNISGPSGGGYASYSGSPIVLSDSAGAASAVSLTAFHVGVDGVDGGVTSGTPQQVLFGGGLNNNYGDAGFTITGLGAFSSYQIYVYYSAYAYGAARNGQFTDTANPGLTYYAAGIGNYATEFTLSNSVVSSSYAGGNYVVFSGLGGTNPTETITYGAGSPINRVMLTGFQVVGVAAIPEPSSYALISAALLGVWCCYHRHRLSVR